jgi:hypothetical protein
MNNTQALLPPMDFTTSNGLVRYKKTLLNRPYSPAATRIVDCIDFILEQAEGVQHG